MSSLKEELARVLFLCYNFFMGKIKVKTYDEQIDKIILNEINPRQISKKEFEELKKSLKNFPEMRELREIVIDENNKILGGHQRLEALKKLGEKTVFVKKVEGLTEEQKREFIIKDNSSSGDWDFDILANLWDTDELDKWLDEKVKKKLPEKDAEEVLTVTEEILKQFYEPKPLDDITFDLAVENDRRFDELEKRVEKMPEGELKKIFRKRLNDFQTFNFDIIADYYAGGASDEERELMEKLGLVFVTSEKAVRNGFAKIDELIADWGGA